MISRIISRNLKPTKFHITKQFSEFDEFGFQISKLRIIQNMSNPNFIYEINKVTRQRDQATLLIIIQARFSSQNPPNLRSNFMAIKNKIDTDSIMDILTQDLQNLSEEINLSICKFLSILYKQRLCKFGGDFINNYFDKIEKMVDSDKFSLSASIVLLKRLTVFGRKMTSIHKFIFEKIFNNIDALNRKEVLNLLLSCSKHDVLNSSIKNNLLYYVISKGSHIIESMNLDQKVMCFFWIAQSRIDSRPPKFSENLILNSLSRQLIDNVHLIQSYRYSFIFEAFSYLPTSHTRRFIGVFNDEIERSVLKNSDMKIGRNFEWYVKSVIRLKMYRNINISMKHMKMVLNCIDADLERCNSDDESSYTLYQLVQQFCLLPYELEGTEAIDARIRKVLMKDDIMSVRRLVLVQYLSKKGENISQYLKYFSKDGSFFRLKTPQYQMLKNYLTTSLEKDENLTIDDIIILEKLVKELDQDRKSLREAHTEYFVDPLDNLFDFDNHINLGDSNIKYLLTSFQEQNYLRLDESRILLYTLKNPNTRKNHFKEIVKMLRASEYSLMTNSFKTLIRRNDISNIAYYIINGPKFVHKSNKFKDCKITSFILSQDQILHNILAYCTKLIVFIYQDILKNYKSINPIKITFCLAEGTVLVSLMEKYEIENEEIRELIVKLYYLQYIDDVKESRYLPIYNYIQLSNMLVYTSVGDYSYVESHFFKCSQHKATNVKFLQKIASKTYCKAVDEGKLDSLNSQVVQYLELRVSDMIGELKSANLPKNQQVNLIIQMISIPDHFIQDFIPELLTKLEECRGSIGGKAFQDMSDMIIFKLGCFNGGKGLLESDQRSLIDDYVEFFEKCYREISENGGFFKIRHILKIFRCYTPSRNPEIYEYWVSQVCRHSKIALNKDFITTHEIIRFLSFLKLRIPKSTNLYIKQLRENERFQGDFFVDIVKLMAQFGVQKSEKNLLQKQIVEMFELEADYNFSDRVNMMQIILGGASFDNELEAISSFLDAKYITNLMYDWNFDQSTVNRYYMIKYILEKEYQEEYWLQQNWEALTDQAQGMDTFNKESSLTGLFGGEQMPELESRLQDFGLSFTYENESLDGMKMTYYVEERNMYVVVLGEDMYDFRGDNLSGMGLLVERFIDCLEKASNSEEKIVILNKKKYLQMEGQDEYLKEIGISI